jgi:hypothetical protein
VGEFAAKPTAQLAVQRPSAPTINSAQTLFATFQRVADLFSHACACQEEAVSYFAALRVLHP